jgi:hypothetical protein
MEPATKNNSNSFGEAFMLNSVNDLFLFIDYILSVAWHDLLQSYNHKIYTYYYALTLKSRMLWSRSWE